MTTDSIFRLASMTKPIVTVAALSLAEEGKLLLSDPVSKFIPALANRQVGIERKDPATGQTTLTLVPAEREMTIQDLMRHTSGITYGNRGTSQVHKMYPESSNWSSVNLTSKEFVDQLAKAPLLHQPGTTWDYSLSTDVLGLVVEAVSGKPLDVFLEERIYKPLKMSDTSFVVPGEKRARIAQPLAVHPDTGKPYVLHDPAMPRKFDCGGGCAVSTAGDYARFAQMLLNLGTLDGARILGTNTVKHMTSDHLGSAISRGSNYFPGPGYTWGLGVSVREDNGLAAIPGSAGDYFWPGAFATYWWADPKEELVVVSMLQAPFGRHYIPLVRQLVLQSIVQ
jgi:CubicO group peptidase (beta-lactamase class C family)